MADLEDRVLARQMAMGDTGALEDLYDRYASLIYSFALRMVGQSSASSLIVEETFVAAWQQAGAIVGQPGTVRDWLVSHAHTAGIAGVHQRRAGGGTALDVSSAIPGSESTDVSSSIIDLGSEEASELAEQRACTQKAWGGLTPEQKLILELAFFQGYTQEEIAPLAGLPAPKVTQDLAVALESLTAAAVGPLGRRLS